MTLGHYTVTGNREYRGHQPGEEFEAYIPPGPERRAILRGDITLHGRVEPTLPRNYELPHGWGHNEGGK